MISFGMIVFAALGVWALVALGRGGSVGADRSDRTADVGSERILDERFARGEIDADEYHSRRADLHEYHLADTRS